MIVEPLPRKDGRCLVCENPITTITKYGEADAFCRSKCAREYFGTQLAVDVDGVKSVLAQERTGYGEER